MEYYQTIVNRILKSIVQQWTVEELLCLLHLVRNQKKPSQDMIAVTIVQKIVPAAQITATKHLILTSHKQ